VLIYCWAVQAGDPAKEEGFAEVFWQATACTKHLPGAGVPSEATLLLPLTWPDSAHQQPPRSQIRTYCSMETVVSSWW